MTTFWRQRHVIATTIEVIICTIEIETRLPTPVQTNLGLPV
jgi:hypothetical protein